MKTGCQEGTRWPGSSRFGDSDRECGGEWPCIVASRPFGVVIAPGFVSASPGPTRFPGLAAHGATRGHRRIVDVQGIEHASDGRQASRRLRGKPKAPRDGLSEGALLDAEP